MSMPQPVQSPGGRFAKPESTGAGKRDSEASGNVMGQGERSKKGALGKESTGGSAEYIQGMAVKSGGTRTPANVPAVNWPSQAGWPVAGSKGMQRAGASTERPSSSVALRTTAPLCKSDKEYAIL